MSAIVLFVVTAVVKTEVSDRGNKRRVKHVLVGNFKIVKELKELSSIYLIAHLCLQRSKLQSQYCVVILLHCCKSSCGFVNNNRFESHSHFVGLK